MPKVTIHKNPYTDLGFLETLKAPQLRSLQGFCSEELGVHALQVTLPRYQEQEQQAVACLERCTRGVLRHCNRLRLMGWCSSTEEGALAALQVLGRGWRPDLSLVDGSHPLVKAEAGSSTSGSRSARMSETADGWHLELKDVHLSESALAALPQGLTHLELW
jgi:hypothetical protein